MRHEVWHFVPQFGSLRTTKSIYCTKMVALLNGGYLSFERKETGNGYGGSWPPAINGRDAELTPSWRLLGKVREYSVWLCVMTFGSARALRKNRDLTR